MTRIKVDPGALQTASEHLRRAVAVAHDIRHERGLLLKLVEDAGSLHFSDAVEDFLEQWSWGLGFMESDGKALADMLGGCAEAYVEVEASVTASLDDG
jgi:hypothetical protein